MTLCRWLQIPNPGDLHHLVTPDAYGRWMEYYQRNACHPLSVPLSIGVNTYNVRAAANRKNVQGCKAADFVAYMPKEKTDFTDPDSVTALAEKRM